MKFLKKLVAKLKGVKVPTQEELKQSFRNHIQEHRANQDRLQALFVKNENEFQNAITKTIETVDESIVKLDESKDMAIKLAISTHKRGYEALHEMKDILREGLSEEVTE